jgi:hypothetical protein
MGHNVNVNRSGRPSTCMAVTSVGGAIALAPNPSNAPPSCAITTLTNDTGQWTVEHLPTDRHLHLPSEG